MINDGEVEKPDENSVLLDLVRTFYYTKHVPVPHILHCILLSYYLG